MVVSESSWTIAHVSEDDDADVPEEQVVAKWLEIAPGIDKMAQRIGDPDDFSVSDGSSLSGDDQKSAPYCVSHAVRACLVSGVDHLHAAKSLVVDLEMLHASALYSLVRGSLENLSASFWILHPSMRNDRIERTLRWHARNFNEQLIALEPLRRGRPSESGGKVSQTRRGCYYARNLNSERPRRLPQQHCGQVRRRALG